MYSFTSIPLWCFSCISDGQFLQVNASPSMTSTTANDRIMKYKLVDDIISIVLPPDGVPKLVFLEFLPR